MEDILKDKNIVVGVSGGISAYKAANLVSALVNLGADVHVIMTKNATEIIPELTLETLSKHKVHVEMFGNHRQTFPCADDSYGVAHIELAIRADAFIIAPTTANIIGKVANGIADDMLSTTIMAATCPVIFAPAMNCNMYRNKIVQDNIEKLKRFGYKFIEPTVGHLACGTDDIGKLPDTKTLVGELKRLFE